LTLDARTPSASPDQQGEWGLPCLFRLYATRYRASLSGPRDS
jgi:hypothetical protein